MTAESFATLRFCRTGGECKDYPCPYSAVEEGFNFLHFFKLLSKRPRALKTYVGVLKTTQMTPVRQGECISKGRYQ